MASDVGYGDGILDQHSVLCSSNSRLVQSLGEVCSERMGASSMSSCRMSSSMRPAVESWAWNSSMESCFSPSTSHWCFSVHHHVHHLPCSVPPRTSSAMGPASPTIPVHEAAMGGEVAARDVFSGFVTDGEGRGGALSSAAADGASLCSQGSGGESEYCVPARYTPCTQAKSTSSSSSASTASNSTCSSLSCSWYDKPKPGQNAGATTLAAGEDSSHAASSGLSRVPVMPLMACPKHHHHHHAPALPASSGDNGENYDTPKNVAGHSCPGMESNQKSTHHIPDNPCHSSAGIHCDHYDTPRKVKEALRVCPNGGHGGEHASATSNYDIPLRFHHVPCCCPAHNVGSSTACCTAHRLKESDGRHVLEEKGLSMKPHHVDCAESLSPSHSRVSNESPSSLDVKSGLKSRCGAVGVSMSECYKHSYVNEPSQFITRACCHADSSCCMGNWPVGRAENRESAKLKGRAPPKNSNLYENLNFAQSLEHYENVKELLVRSELDVERSHGSCQMMTGHRDSGGENNPNNSYAGENAKHMSQSVCEKDGVKLCKKCGHSFWCPLKEAESRPCNTSGEIYSNLSALNQSLAGTCNIDAESTSQSPKKTFYLGRLPEKSASIPSLHHFSLQFENALLPHKSRYHMWRPSSAPTLCRAEENFSAIWDFPHQHLGGRADLYSLGGYYPCTCRDLMAGCIQRGKPGNSRSEGKFTPHLQSTGPTSLNSSVVSSTTASAVSLQLPSNARVDVGTDAKKPVDESGATPASAEESAEPTSSSSQASAESNRVNVPANNVVQIVRRSSAHPGRPIAAGNGGNRDSSGSNDSGVSSTGSVGGGGLVVPVPAPPCPNQPPSPPHSRCRRSRIITHPSPWCFHASLPHPKSNCSLRSSSVHSHPHLESLRSRSCSDPLRPLSCTPPLTPSRGMAVMMAACSESSDSSSSKSQSQQGGEYFEQ